MQQRLLFVAGMTIGVMAPIVWGSYISRPPGAITAPSSPTLAVTATAGAAPDAAPLPPPVTTEVHVQAIASTPVQAPVVRTTASIPLPVKPPALAVHPDPPKPRRMQAPATSKPEKARQSAEHRPHELQIPTVVSRYVGPHVIVICDALTARQKHYAGCP